MPYATTQIVVGGVLEPSYEIAGDSFDYAIGDGFARLAIFDAMGHGLDAAQMATLAVGAGDRVLLFTDGVTEARSATGAFFGENRLDDVVGGAELRTLPVPETLRRLAHAVVQYQNGSAHDDVTVVMLEWCGDAGHER